MIQRTTDPSMCRQRILEDHFLHYVYSRIYFEMIRQYLPLQIKYDDWTEVALSVSDKKVIEIGSAGGILKEFLQFAITSDIRSGDGVDEYQDAQEFSYPNDSVDLILGKDVLHHLPDVAKHFHELERILKQEGKAVYLEPNWNFISKFVFRYLHPEKWDTKSKTWQFVSTNPMDANQALARNIFIRDAAEFYKSFPSLNFYVVDKPLNGLSFLISGGVTMRSKVPSQFLLKIAKLENSNFKWMKLFGFNRIIVITKT